MGLTVGLIGAVIVGVPGGASAAPGGAVVGRLESVDGDRVSELIDQVGEDPSPEALVTTLASLSDDDLGLLMDRAADEAEASLSDPDATADEIAGSTQALAELRSPAGRESLVTSIRSASADNIVNEVDPSSGEIDTAEDPRVDLPSVPASDPLQPPVPSPKVGVTPAAPPVDTAADDGSDGGSDLRIKPPKGSSADWVYQTRTTDAASYQRFQQVYAQWWAIVSGSQSESVAGSPQRILPIEPDEPTENGRWFDPFDTCAGPQLGSRSAPAVATRPGTVFTPTTDTFASDTPVAGQSRPVYAGGGASTGGTFTTRWVGGVEQFLVEANITSSPGSILAFFMPEIYVGRFGQGEVRFDPDSADVDVLCYANDAGQIFPYRGYVQAWLPVSLLVEPGIQVRVDVGNRALLPFIPPHLLFFGGDMTTVHIGPRPLGAREVVSHAIGLQIDDSVIVDTDNNPGNDLEGILAPQLADSITTSINGTSSGPNAVSWQGFPFLGWVTVRTSAVTRPVTTDLSLQPVAPGDDERAVRAGISIGEAVFRGSFNGLLTGYLPCYYQHTWYSPNAGVDFVVNVDSANPRVLHPGVIGEAWADISTRKWGLTNGSWIRPMCHIVGIFVRTGMKKSIAKSIKEGLAEAFSPGAGPTHKVDEILRSIDLTSAMESGGQFPNGNGVTFPAVKGAGWMRTCVPRGCQGGGVAISADGIEAALALNAADRKQSSNNFRFPLVYSASSVGVDQLIRTHTDANGQPFSLGVILNNGFLNQVLRAVTEGSAGPDPSNPSLAPNGILDQEFSFPLLGQQIGVRMSPNVAPAFINVPPDPGNPNSYQAVVGLPDLRLRIDDGSGWGDPAIIGVTAFAALDVATVSNQTIDPSFRMGSESHVLRCHSLIWLVCTPLWGTAVDLAVAAVATALDASLTDITVPQLGPDFAFGNIRLQRRGAQLALYLNLYPKPRIELSGWYDKPWYGFHANATFPPGPPISYQWEIRDMLKPAVPGNPNANIVYTGTTLSPDITQNMGPLTRILIRKAGLFNHSVWQRKVRVRVVATSGGLSTAGSYDMVMTTKIW